MVEKKEKDWICHYICSCEPCEECGDINVDYLPGICDAHTHGMNLYNHLEFQVVVDVGPYLIGYLLNTMGRRVQAGETFKDGDVVTGIVNDKSGNDLPIRLKEVLSDEEQVLRIILPDKDGFFPDNPKCSEPYSLQHLSQNLLVRTSDNPA